MNTDEERFQYLYEQNVYMLRIIARNRGIPEDEVDDAVQETFLSYYAHYPLTWPDRKARMMLVKIMRNLCIDYLRVKKRRPVEFYDPATLDESIFSELKGRDTGEVAMENLVFKDLLEGLRSMREDWLQAFIFYVIQGRTIDEVSKILGISEAACRMRITRGRKYLRDYMEEQNGMAQAQKRKRTPISTEPDVGFPCH